MEPPVVLCGLGQVGRRVLDAVRAAGHPVVAIDPNPPADDPRLAGVRIIRGDCRRRDLLEQAGVREARGVVIVTSDDLVNVSAALLVRKLNPTARVVVRMFNQNLIPRFGSAVKNTVALSVSALTAPVLALTAATGDVLGAFKLESGPQQICELAVAESADLDGRTLADAAREFRLLPLAYLPADGEPKLLTDVPPDARLAPGDRVVVSGSPAELRPLLERARGDLLPGVLWAGAVRRWLRTAARTLGEVDTAVKVCTAVLFLTLFASSLVFRFGIGTAWADGLFQTVRIVATGSDLPGEGRPEWAKVFLSVLKIAGAALVAAFTAIFTNYLIRARLGGALEVRRIPDGGHVVVCGLGNIGYRVVEELTAIGVRVVGIEKVADNPFVATCRRKGVAAVIGDATIPEVLRQARADTARAVIAATFSELANLEIALLVREMNPNQRVVVRLTDPDFAQAVREAAGIRYAVSAPALAAPVFAAALYGDHVQALVTAGGHTLAAVEITVQADDPCLCGKLLGAVARDYRLLPVAVAGRPPFGFGGTPRGLRLEPGDRLTAVAELPALERLVRRDAAPAAFRVVADSPDAVLADHLTRGEAEELMADLARDGRAARVETAGAAG